MIPRSTEVRTFKKTRTEAVAYTGYYVRTKAIEFLVREWSGVSSVSAA